MVGAWMRWVGLLLLGDLVHDLVEVAVQAPFVCCDGVRQGEVGPVQSAHKIIFGPSFHRSIPSYLRRMTRAVAGRCPPRPVSRVPLSSEPFSLTRPRRGCRPGVSGGRVVAGVGRGGDVERLPHPEPSLRYVRRAQHPRPRPRPRGRHPGRQPGLGRREVGRRRYLAARGLWRREAGVQSRVEQARDVRVCLVLEGAVLSGAFHRPWASSREPHAASTNCVLRADSHHRRHAARPEDAAATRPENRPVRPWPKAPHRNRAPSCTPNIGT